MKRTAGAFPNTPNSDPRVASVASSISSPKRRSGLSLPKRACASPCVMRSNGVTSSSPIPSRQTAAHIRSMSAKRNSWSGNAISTSSCVISWTRSARRSSSLKQMAIW